jgi:hypothetical protein
VIADIVPNEKVPAGTELIDADGGYIAPGLIDLHIHGYLGADTCDCDPAGIYTIAKGVVSNGVTGFLPTTMTVAPMIGSPVSSTTVPFTVFCAQANVGLKTTKSAQRIDSTACIKPRPLPVWDKCFIVIEF